MDPLQTTTPPASEPKSFGALIGIVVVIALIVSGGVYFITQRSTDNTDSNATSTQGELPPLSQEDDVDSIESDLNATVISDEDFSSFDSEFNAQ